VEQNKTVKGLACSFVKIYCLLSFLKSLLVLENMVLCVSKHWPYDS